MYSSASRFPTATFLRSSFVLSGSDWSLTSAHVSPRVPAQGRFSRIAFAPRRCKRLAAMARDMSDVR